MGLFFKKLIALVLAGAVAPTAEPTRIASTPSVHLDEILTFECARHVVELTPVERRSGPVFHSDDLVLTSVTAANGQKLLILNAGAGTYTAPLAREGVSRIRFSIPVTGRLQPRAYFVSYLHGNLGDSRVFELAAEQAPPGRDEIDYQPVNLRRAEYLLPHLEFGVYQTVTRIASAVNNRRLGRNEVGHVNVASCDHLSRRSPALARTLRTDLEILENYNRPIGGGRLPASLAALNPFCERTGPARGPCVLPRSSSTWSKTGN